MTATAEPAEVLAGLRALRVLLADPDHWTQGASARDESGAVCASRSPEAVRWCLHGGMHKVTPPLAAWLRWDMVWVFSEAGTPENISGFNDSSPHAAILDAIDAAIALAERRVAA